MCIIMSVIIPSIDLVTYMYNYWPSPSLEVRFQLTENDYRSNEAVKLVPAVVNKNVRLANPVTFCLTPFNVSEAEDTGQPLPTNIPPDDNPLSPNRAKCKAVLYYYVPPTQLLPFGDKLAALERSFRCQHGLNINTLQFNLLYSTHVIHQAVHSQYNT